MRRNSLLFSCVALILMFCVVSCSKNPFDDDFPGKPDINPVFYDASVPIAWFNLGISLARTTPGNTGPVVARSFGYMGLALYESVVPGSSDYRSLQSQLNGLPQLPKPKGMKTQLVAISANAALASITRQMFANAPVASQQRIDSLENAFNAIFQASLSQHDFGNSAVKDLTKAAQFGKDIAAAIYTWSTTDGGDKAYLTPAPPSYVPPVGPGLWVPAASGPATNPFWGANRTFIKNIASSTQPPAPPAYSTDPSSQIYQEELEVYNESINPLPEHTAIARYWAAIPPPTVSVSILTSVLHDKSSSLSRAGLGYCELGLAISDAFVSCYKTKFQYNQLRPITYIRANFNPTWLSLIPTPPFPDYTSAHSVQTGAAARVLADLFGDNTTFTDYSINDLGFTPRTFTKFSDYANEVGLSRIYGGIHIRSSDFVGLAQGDKVGLQVTKLRFRD